MKKARTFITIGIIIIITVPFSPKGQESALPLSSESSAKIPELIDKTNVQDPALKEVLQQIEEKLPGINEYSYVEEVSTVVMQGEMAYREERCFRRPNLFFAKLNQTKHILLDMIGSVTYSVVDGKNLWRYVQNAPGSGKLMVERIGAKGKFPPAEIETMIKRHETPKVYKYDLSRLRQAGYSEENIVRSGTLLKPFRPCDMATLKLESESAEAWVFTARPSEPMMDTALLRLTINKNDGILRKVECVKADGKVFSTQAITQVRLNPGLRKTLFSFSPPPGIEIDDDTEDIIQSLRRQGVKPRKQADFKSNDIQIKKIKENLAEINDFYAEFDWNVMEGNVKRHLGEVKLWFQKPYRIRCGATFTDIHEVTKQTWTISDGNILMQYRFHSPDSVSVRKYRINDLIKANVDMEYFLRSFIRYFPLHIFETFSNRDDRITFKFEGEKVFNGQKCLLFEGKYEKSEEEVQLFIRKDNSFPVHIKRTFNEAIEEVHAKSILVNPRFTDPNIFKFLTLQGHVSVNDWTENIIKVYPKRNIK